MHWLKMEVKQVLQDEIRTRDLQYNSKLQVIQKQINVRERPDVEALKGLTMVDGSKAKL